MGDLLARADDFEKKAGKMLNRWSLFGITVISPNYEAAAELYDKAANAFKLAESWDRAGAAYVKLASCHFELNSKHETANDFADAAHCYKKSNIQESIFWLERCVELFLEIEKLSICARYYEEIAELYEQQENLEKAILYNEKAAELFQVEDVSTCANQCMQKIAQFASQLQQYPEAIEIYEHIARQSLSNSLLKCGAKGYLLNAGICQLCKGKGDVVAIQDALERYLELDPTFSETREYILLANLAAAIDEKDITKFTDSVRMYDSSTHLDSWKITLLLRVKEALKTKELEQDDFT